MRPGSLSVVSNTTLWVRMENLVGERRHRHRPHTVAVLQGAEMIEDVAQKRQVFLQVNAEIVRVPPQMKERSALRCRFHRASDAPQAQALQRGILSYWPQEATRRDVDHAVDERWFMVM